MIAELQYTYPTFVNLFRGQALHSVCMLNLYLNKIVFKSPD